MRSSTRGIHSRSLAGLVALCCGVLSAARLPAQETAVTRRSALAAAPDASLPGGAFARLGTPHAVVTGRIKAATYSPDGRWLAVISQNRGNNQAHLALLDANTRALVRMIGPIDVREPVLRFSHDNQALLTSEASWTVPSGEKSKHAVEDKLAAVSPNGKYLVFNRDLDRKLVVWDASIQKEFATLELRPGARTFSTAVTDDRAA